MLFVGHGCLCLVDAVDAGIRSGGDPLTFALRLNGVAWLRFAHLGFEEIRARFCKDALNTDQMELDLAAGWDALLQESAIG